MSTPDEVLNMLVSDEQVVDVTQKTAIELKEFLEGCGCFELTPCLVRYQKQTSAGCIYKQIIRSDQASYMVHRLAVLGSLPSLAVKRGFAHQDSQFSVTGYYARGNERFAPLGPMWFIGAKEPDVESLEQVSRADKPIQIEILDLGETPARLSLKNFHLTQNQQNPQE